MQAMREEKSRDQSRKAAPYKDKSKRTTNPPARLSLRTRMKGGDISTRSSRPVVPYPQMLEDRSVFLAARHETVKLRGGKRISRFENRNRAGKAEGAGEKPREKGEDQ